MDSNIINLSNKIENIIKKSTEFDNICIDVLSDVTNKNINKKIYNLTNYYMDIRSNHGELLLLENNLKKNINKKIRNNIKLQKGGKQVDNNNNGLYDLSTFTSIIENVSNVVNNVDFEFKKIALMFPKYINTNKENVLFFKERNKNTKYSKWIDEIKEEDNNDIDINVIELSSKDIDGKYNLSKISSNDVDIKIRNLPSMYIINNDNITEIELKGIKNINEFKNYLN
jgi:hypothetical protein